VHDEAAAFERRIRKLEIEVLGEPGNGRAPSHSVRFEISQVSGAIKDLRQLYLTDRDGFALWLERRRPWIYGVLAVNTAVAFGTFAMVLWLLGNLPP
jgi:hypothetical protein